MIVPTLLLKVPNILRGHHDDIDGDAESEERLMNLLGQPPAVRHARFHHEQVHVAVRSHIAARRGAEQHDTIRLCDGDDAPDDVVESQPQAVVGWPHALHRMVHEFVPQLQTTPCAVDDLRVRSSPPSQALYVCHCSGIVRQAMERFARWLVRHPLLVGGRQPGGHCRPGVLCVQDSHREHHRERPAGRGSGGQLLRPGAGDVRQRRGRRHRRAGARLVRRADAGEDRPRHRRGRHASRASSASSASPMRSIPPPTSSIRRACCRTSPRRPRRSRPSRRSCSRRRSTARTWSPTTSAARRSTSSSRTSPTPSTTTCASTRRFEQILADEHGSLLLHRRRAREAGRGRDDAPRPGALHAAGAGAGDARAVAVVLDRPRRRAADGVGAVRAGVDARRDGAAGQGDHAWAPSSCRRSWWSSAARTGST